MRKGKYPSSKCSELQKFTVPLNFLWIILRVTCDRKEIFSHSTSKTLRVVGGRGSARLAHLHTARAAGEPEAPGAEAAGLYQ